MDITHQPSTIGKMSLQHFQTYMTTIIKGATDERFDAIELRLDHLEADSVQTTNNIIEIGNALEELKKGQLRAEENFRRIDENFKQVEDLIHGSQTRLDHMERDIIRHDRKLEELVA